MLSISSGMRPIGATCACMPTWACTRSCFSDGHDHALAATWRAACAATLLGADTTADSPRCTTNFSGLSRLSLRHLPGAAARQTRAPIGVRVLPGQRLLRPHGHFAGCDSLLPLLGFHQSQEVNEHRSPALGVTVRRAGGCGPPARTKTAGLRTLGSHTQKQHVGLCCAEAFLAREPGRRGHLGDGGPHATRETACAPWRRCQPGVAGSDDAAPVCARHVLCLSAVDGMGDVAAGRGGPGSENGRSPRR